MDYRPLTVDDRERSLALEQYAFQQGLAPSLLDADRLAQFRGLFLDGQFVAQLEIFALRVQLGHGADAPMGGLGAVASVPELRRRGHVEILLRHAVDELRAAGVNLCMLYPFKSSFYGRYGWATCMERRAYKGAPALFRSFKSAPGRWVPVDRQTIPELDQIHRAALRGRFGVLVRDEAWWAEQILQDWEGRPRHGYIWRDEAGRGRAYTIFRFNDTTSGRTIVCRDMVALDPEARAQLFAFMAGHEDQIAEVEFRAPADAPVNLLFPNPLHCALEPHFMLRLLDVPAALEAYPFPRELSGRFSFTLTDDWIATNQGSFLLELSAGRGMVSRLAAGAATDLQLDARVLTQLYSRLLRPRTAATFGLLTVDERTALDLAEQAFTGLAPFSSDMF